jgi:hypothetical protein
MWTVTNLKYRTEDGIAIKAEAKYQIVTNNIQTSNTIWVRLPEPAGDVIPFEQLTEQEVLTWVFALYDTASVEVKVQEDHDKLLAQPVQDGVPWLN